MEVIKIHPELQKRSNHDINFEGQILRFDLEPCSNGVVGVYYTEIPLKEVLKKKGVPEFLLDRADGIEDRTHKEVVVRDHIHRKWHHKLFGISIERLVLRWIRKQKEEFAEIEARSKATGIIKKLIEGE